MLFNYDLSAAPVLRPVDDGVYLLKIISAKVKENEKGTTVISWEYHIEEPKEVIVDGAKVETVYLPQYISKDEPQKSLGFIRDQFEACDKLEVGKKDFDTDDLLGCLVGAELTKTAGTPEFPNPQNRVKKWFKHTEMPPVGLKPKQ
jgi:hypothetical protein